MGVSLFDLEDILRPHTGEKPTSSRCASAYKFSPSGYNPYVSPCLGIYRQIIIERGDFHT